jgi:hypothetical protein
MLAAALIPAHNEASRIGATVAAVLGIPGVQRVFVADDGSSDSTAHLAREAGAQVVPLERSGGKGAALNLAAQALIADAELWSTLSAVLLLDGDLGESAAGAAALLAPLAASSADMTIGVLPRQGEGFGLVTGAAHRAILQATGFDAQAPLSGQRALTPACLSATLPFAHGYGVEVALTVTALRASMRVVELPVELRHRASTMNLAGILHRAHQFIDVKRAIRKLR